MTYWNGLGLLTAVGLLLCLHLTAWSGSARTLRPLDLDTILESVRRGVGVPPTDGSGAPARPSAIGNGKGPNA